MSLHDPSLEEANYRTTTNPNVNCTKCKYCDWDEARMMGMDGVFCRFFRIETDENHVCDRLWK